MNYCERTYNIFTFYTQGKTYLDIRTVLSNHYYTYEENFKFFCFFSHFFKTFKANWMIRLFLQSDGLFKLSTVSVIILCLILEQTWLSRRRPMILSKNTLTFLPLLQRLWNWTSPWLRRWLPWPRQKRRHHYVWI